MIARHDARSATRQCHAVEARHSFAEWNFCLRCAPKRLHDWRSLLAIQVNDGRVLTRQRVVEACFASHAASGTGEDDLVGATSQPEEFDRSATRAIHLFDAQPQRLSGHTGIP